MTSSAEQIGRTLPPAQFLVSRETICEYALAVGESNPLYLDLEAARAAGYEDLVAPPMFAAVYAGPAFDAAMRDPELGIDLTMLVHGGQEFEWGPLVVAGDEITTAIRLAEVSERLGMTFYVWHSSSQNQREQEVSRGSWTVIVRPRE